MPDFKLVKEGEQPDPSQKMSFEAKHINDLKRWLNDRFKGNVHESMSFLAAFQGAILATLATADPKNIVPKEKVIEIVAEQRDNILEVFHQIYDQNMKAMAEKK